MITFRIAAPTRPATSVVITVGLEVCILDPDLDEDGALAAALTRRLVGVLTGREPERLGMPWGSAR